MGDKTRAPWTDEQCDKLNEFQKCRWSHPFTCGGNRSDAAHRAYQAQHGGDFGQLIAKPSGWICPVCLYHQDWAHDFMFRGAPPNPLAVYLPPSPTPSPETGIVYLTKQR